MRLILSSRSFPNFPPEVKEAFSLLENALDLSSDFKLIFAVCDSPIDQETVIRALWRSGRRYRIARISNVARPVLEQLDKQVGPGRTPLMVMGFENLAFPGADQVGMVQNLNITRPLWPERFRRAVVFWLTRDSERLMTQFAPDFYRFRSTSIDFPFPDQPGRRRIWELRRRVERVAASPETTMRWWWELGQRKNNVAFNEAIRIACEYDLDLPLEGIESIKDVYLRGDILTLRPLMVLPHLQSLGIGDGMGRRLPAAEFSPRALEELAFLTQPTETRLSVERRERLDVLGAIVRMPRLSRLSIVGDHYSSRPLPEPWVLTPLFFDLIASRSELVKLSIGWCRVTVEGLDRLAGMRLQEFTMAGPDVVASYVSHFPRSIQTLHLSGDNLGDEALNHFAPFTKLESLSLPDARVTGKTLDLLCLLPRLRYLGLARSLLADEFCSKFADMVRLRDLDLSHTKISDGAISSLARSVQIKRLDVSHTAMTTNGIRVLREALPNCRVFSNSPFWGGRLRRP